MKQAKDTRCVVGRAVGLSVCAAVLALQTAACSKRSEGQSGTAKSSEGRTLGPASAVAVATVPASSASATPLSGGALDSCLVGSWKTSQVSLRRERISAVGGAGIAVEIQPTGAIAIDFGPMSVITADAPPTVFNYSYSGKATANLSTPTPGTFKAVGADNSKVTVTAKVTLPGAGAVDLFKNTPLTELEALGKAAATKPDDDLPLPELAGPAPGQQAIDAAPILSGTTYRCGGDRLELAGPPGSSAWQLERVR